MHSWVSLKEKDPHGAIGPRPFACSSMLWRHFQDEALAEASDYMAASKTRTLYESIAQLVGDAELPLALERHGSLQGARWLEAFNEELIGALARDPRFA